MIINDIKVTSIMFHKSGRISSKANHENSKNNRQSAEESEYSTGTGKFKSSNEKQNPFAGMLILSSKL